MAIGDRLSVSVSHFVISGIFPQRLSPRGQQTTRSRFATTQRLTPTVVASRPSALNKVFRMIFLPITDGGRDGHVTWIGGFVVLRQFFGRAVPG